MHSAVSQKGRFRELSHQLGAEFTDIGSRIHSDHAKKAATCRSLCRACEKLNPERNRKLIWQMTIILFSQKLLCHPVWTALCKHVQLIEYVGDFRATVLGDIRSDWLAHISAVASNSRIRIALACKDYDYRFAGYLFTNQYCFFICQIDRTARRHVGFHAGDRGSNCFASRNTLVGGGPLFSAEDVSSNVLQTHGNHGSHCPFWDSFNGWLDRLPDLGVCLFAPVQRSINGCDCRRNIRATHAWPLGLPRQFKGSDGTSSRS